MAQILISESHNDVRRLLARMVTRLGHQPQLASVPSPDALLSAELLLVEPAGPMGAMMAQTASIAVPSLPIICASVSPPPEELEKLGVVFTDSLLKPFTIGQLSVAINRALRMTSTTRNGHHQERWNAA